jgi:(p)ppGpp synthase/HD superfamily hydrolase
LAKTNLAKSHIKKQTKAGLLQRLKEKLSPARLFKKTERKEEKIAPAISVLIGGKSGIAFTLAKCCQPKASEEISAYLTKDKGATVHLQTCQNLKRLKGRFPGKILEAEWQ